MQSRIILCTLYFIIYGLKLTTPKPQVSEASNKFKERILQLIKAMGNGPPTTATTPDQFQGWGMKGKSPDDAKGSDFWDIVKEMLKNVAGTLASKPSQAIVQEAEQEKEYSLLQNIKSGRVRGPVHVYGHHSGSREYDD
ncbi:uncharacterized protein LOC134796293 [Cydia splendana]|uniref:uncharacterized protein LOC134796293 n=1 Tax=Cydia splendana TaxID=1100963 RepID=UPI00300D5DCE